MTTAGPPTALALVCTLSPSPAESSTDLPARQVLDEPATHDVTGSVVRVVDHDVRPGVEADPGDGDEWPAVRTRIADADTRLLGVTYRNGEAAHGTDDKDLPGVPDAVASTTRTAAADVAHLARLLRTAQYPPKG